MKYHEIMKIKNAVGLPWKDDDSVTNGIIDDNGVYTGQLESHHHAQYAIHAANTLPILVDALQYYFDVMEEANGPNWKDRVDHVQKKFIEAMEEAEKLTKLFSL